VLVKLISFSSIFLLLNLLVAVAHEVVHLIGGRDVASHPRMANQSGHRKSISRILLEHLSEEVFQLFGGRVILGQFPEIVSCVKHEMLVLF